jgi:quinol monooxygenase YgiN
MSNAPDLSLFLLSIRGTLAAPTLEASRKIHNETAGAPANVAAAQSLGDVSHMVHVPVHSERGANEFLILDIWTSMDGLGQFFANPTVQEQAGQIFMTRDPVVWAPAAGFVSYHIPAPFGRNDRIVSIARGTVPSVEKAMKIHNAGTGAMISKARKAGNLSHEAYLRMAAPGSPEALEFFAVDVWMDHDSMSAYYDMPEFLQTLDGLFTAEPNFSVWTHPKGDWVEW